MPRLRPCLPGFHDELEKMAGPLGTFIAKNHGALGSAGALLGHGAALGAAVGGLHSAYKGYQDAKEQGAGTGSAAIAGLAGGLGGALHGSTIGGVLGGGAGFALGKMSPEKAETLRKALSSTERRVGALGRFGQRQVHGLTGWTPSEGLSSDAIRGGTWGAERAAHGAAGTSNFDKLDAAHQLQKKVVREGLDNIPGVLSAMKGPNRLDAAKTLLHHSWTNGDALMKAQMLMAPLGVAGALMLPGDNKGEQVGASVGNLAGTMASTALPFFGGRLAMDAATGAGRAVGKTVDWARRKATSHSDRSDMMTNEGQHMPSERDFNTGVPEGMR